MQGKLSQTLTGWQVLVVEDDIDTLSVLRALLELLGASVLTARDGAQALNSIRQQRPDFIISDLAMPVMDGWELAAVMQKDRALATIPLFALTASSSAEDRSRALAAGFANDITKPITADTFHYELLRSLTLIPQYARHFEPYMAAWR